MLLPPRRGADGRDRDLSTMEGGKEEDAEEERDVEDVVVWRDRREEDKEDDRGLVERLEG